MTWTRPDDIAYPMVWRTFQGKVLVDGRPLEYKIQDITEDLKQPIITHLTRYFLIRESICAHEGIIEDEESVQEMLNIWEEAMAQRIGFVAIVEGDGDITKRIAGCNLLEVNLKTSLVKEKKGRVMNRLETVIKGLYKKENLFEKYNVDKYLTGVALSVAPQYHGDNISYHLLDARTQLCRAIGVSLTVTAFSSDAAIHLALKNDFQIGQETSNKMLEEEGKPLFPRNKTFRVVLAIKTISPND